MKLSYLIIFSLFITSMIFFSVPSVFAEEMAPTEAKTVSEVKLDNPLTAGEKSLNPSVLIGLIIKSVLGSIGGLALLMMVWGGFQWLTSAGNPEKVKKGSHTMIWAIIGLILVLGSYVLVGAVLQFLSPAGK